MLSKLVPTFEGVEHYVVMGDGNGSSVDVGDLPGALLYEDLLQEAGAGAFNYPDVQERQAAALCYTSGTTGNPKGVLYSHRSISMHSSATLMTDGTGLSRRDRVLAVVPMFHANAWGLPYGATLAGADLIMPDRFLQAEPLARPTGRARRARARAAGALRRPRDQDGGRRFPGDVRGSPLAGVEVCPCHQRGLSLIHI